MDNFIDYKVTSFDVKKPKPSSEGLYKIMNFFKIDKKDVIFIGDTTNDYYAALEADIDFIAYKNILGSSIKINNHLEIFNFLK
jgi:phosphoglycolate phosphatase-like HAD superfamily hydrolase